MINGVFSNGETLSLNPVAIADVDSPRASRASAATCGAPPRPAGRALIGEAGVGGRGALISGAIEARTST